MGEHNTGRTDKITKRFIRFAQSSAHIPEYFDTIECLEIIQKFPLEQYITIAKNIRDGIDKTIPL